MSEFRLHNPDVLNCLANLSNDEVFTPPDVASKMLDLLPQELFCNPDAKFLDPACKTGVFLREIAKRLIKGLADKIPDLQQRIDHIFHNQLYGIAITTITGMLSRRSLYCSKTADGEYTVSHFDNSDGNIRFVRTEHIWKNGRCVCCGASQNEYDRDASLETHAYEFIHTDNAEKILNMKFDVIISNPPYQLTTGGAQAQAIPLYNKFVTMAKKLNPHYLIMITPSRWFTGGFGLDSFRAEMLNDNRIRVIHDFIDAHDCFPGVDIKGGVSYFLWDREYYGDVIFVSHINNEVSSVKRPLLEKNADVFIRYNGALPIYRKVMAANEQSFSSIVSTQRPFGLPTNFTDYHDIKHDGDMTVYGYKFVGYLSNTFKIEKNKELIKKWKLFTPKAVGSGDPREDWIKPIIAEPNTLCTETYVSIGAFNSEQEAQNVYSYTQTKFFHFMLTLKKNTQDCLAKAFSFIPMQDFSKPWTDEELYQKYNLTQDEIAFIESMIKPME